MSIIRRRQVKGDGGQLRRSTDQLSRNQVPASSLFGNQIHPKSIQTPHQNHGRNRFSRCCTGSWRATHCHRNRARNHKQRRHCPESQENQDHQAQTKTRAPTTGPQHIQDRTTSADWHDLQHLVQQVVWGRQGGCARFKAPSQGQV